MEQDTRIAPQGEREGVICCHDWMPILHEEHGGSACHGITCSISSEGVRRLANIIVEGAKSSTSYFSYLYDQSFHDLVDSDMSLLGSRI